MYQNHVTNILRHYLREQQIPINRWDNFGDIVSSGVWWDYVSEVNSHLKWLPFINFRILNDFFLLWLFTIIILIAIRTYVIHRNINWCDKSYFKSLVLVVMHFLVLIILCTWSSFSVFSSECRPSTRPSIGYHGIGITIFITFGY